MKVAYKHLVNFIPSKPSVDDISKNFFQLGHEHEIHNNIFNMELTPNRGDCLSINGLLRDLAAFYEVNLDREIYENEIKPLNLDFINKAPQACPYISFLKIEFAGEISTYKGYLDEYFNDLDVKKNNFFTDISNYISYETGQPTHCYDAKKFKDAFSLEIIDGEYEFETLMDKKIKLKDKNLVFMDNTNIINLAGIMGAKKNSCSKDTKSVIVECAYFNPEVIIGKSLKYNINSEAAHKFERGVDPLCHEKVLRRFLKIVENHVSITNVQLFRSSYQDFKIIEIPFNAERINSILGITLNKEELRAHLVKLGLEISSNKILIPSFRSDIKTENDIAEEVARLIGYNNIPSKPFQIPLMPVDEKFQSLDIAIKKTLLDYGFYEVINNPFINLSKTNAIKIDNPLDSNKDYIRTNLKQSLLDNLLFNERRQQDSIKLFEISDIYYFKEEVRSKKMLGVICSGRVGRNYRDFSKKIDKSYLTEIFKNLSSEININPVYIERKDLDSKSNNQIVYAEFELEYHKNHNFKKFSNTSKKLSSDSFIKFKPISEYPSSSRDLSFLVKDLDKYYELQHHLLNYKDELIKETFIFDFFDNKKNDEIKIGFRFIFQSKVSTITESEVNNVMKKIIKSSLDIGYVSIPGL